MNNRMISECGALCAAVALLAALVATSETKVTQAAHVAPLSVAAIAAPSIAPLAFPRYKRNIRAALRFDLCRDNGAEFEKARDNWLSRSERRGYDRASARLARAYREHGGGDAASENVLRVFCRSV